MILNDGNNATVTTEASGKMGVNEIAEMVEDEEDAWTANLDQLFTNNRRLSLENCIYRGEGNANVVIALPCERKVIRFRKSTRGEASADGGRARAAREVQFLKGVISRFLGTYVEAPEVLRGTPDDMAKLSEAIFHLRPECRRDKDIVETYATKYPDYAFLPSLLDLKSCGRSRSLPPTFCVEIKPKQGFRHDLDQQFRKCTYCMNQYHKLKTGMIRNRSTYCPFDLFSGQMDRMRKALRGLLESPQNNLKIFKDGIIVFDSNSHPNDVQLVFAEWFAAEGSCTVERYFDLFCRLICTALLRVFPQVHWKTDEYLSSEVKDLEVSARIHPDIVAKAKKILYFSGDECEFTGEQLPRDCVLGRIFYMQQLPYYSADVVYKIYSKHLAVLNDEMIYACFNKMPEALREISPTKRKQAKFLSKNSGTEDRVVLADETDATDRFTTTKNSTLHRTESPDNNRNKNKNALNNTYVCDDDYDEVENISYPLRILTSPKMKNNNNNVHRQKRDVGETPEKLLTSNEIQILQNYLLATTAKDCSILMAFQQLDLNMTLVCDDHVVEATEHNRFLVNVGVSDLDLKSIHCIEKHRRRDANVLNAVISGLEEELALRNQLPLDTAQCNGR